MKASNNISLNGKLAQYSFDVSKIFKQGGTGRIYHGHVERSFTSELKEGQSVAIKVIYEDISANQANIIREQEAIRQKVNSKNVLRLYELIEQRGIFHSVFEWLDGQTLQEFLDDDQLFFEIESVHTKKALVKDVLNGLKVLHDNVPTIVHRDIKPSNVMLSSSGTKIIDFGTAKVMRPGSTNTRMGTIIGTPAFSSPEQLKGSVDIDERSDIYSFGNLVYALFARDQPYHGTEFEITENQIKTSIPSHSLNGIPSPFKELIIRCTKKDKSKRFQSVEEIHQHIDRFNTKGRPRPNMSLFTKIPLYSLSLVLILIGTVINGLNPGIWGDKNKIEINKKMELLAQKAGELKEKDMNKVCELLREFDDTGIRTDYLEELRQTCSNKNVTN